MSKRRRPCQPLRVAAAAQQRSSEYAVRRQKQPQPVGKRWRRPCGQPRGGRLYPLRGGCGQHTPDQGELRADPALDVAPQSAVIPELDAKSSLIEQVDQVLHGGADGPAQKHPLRRSSPLRDQRQYSRHRQSVHRAQRQQEKALSHLIWGSDEPCKGFFQQITGETIEQKLQKPLRHNGCSLRLVFSLSGSIPVSARNIQGGSYAG